MVHEINASDFQREVLDNKGKVLLVFYAPWCPHCQRLEKTLSGLGKEFDKIKICKVDVDENPELSDEYNVDSIPVLYLIEDGKIKDKTMGEKTAEELREFSL